MRISTRNCPLGIDSSSETNSTAPEAADVSNYGLTGAPSMFFNEPNEKAREAHFDLGPEKRWSHQCELESAVRISTRNAHWA